MSKNQPGAAPTLALGARIGQNKNKESNTSKAKKVLWSNTIVKEPWKELMLQFIDILWVN